MREGAVVAGKRFAWVAALVAVAMGCDGAPAPVDAGDGGGVGDDGAAPPGDGGVDPRDGGPSGDGGLEPDGGVGPVVPDADPTFGAGGVAVVNVDDLWIGPLWSLVVQPDGNLLAAGRTSDAHVVLRVRPDGSLDPSFGTGGVASVSLGLPWLTPTVAMGVGGIALAPDGSILLAGVVLPIGLGEQRGMVARLTPNGEIDAAFGDGGFVVDDYDVPEGPAANAVAVQPDGRVLVASRDHVDRLMPDGAPDPSFGAAGRSLSMLGGAWADFQAVALDDAGRVVLSGVQGSVGVGRRVFVARLTADGALDATFGTGGVVFDTMADAGSFGSFASARAVAIDDAGRIVVGAARTPGEATLSVGRFTASGAPDATFGTGGWASATDGVSYGGPTARIALQSDGGIVALGGSGVAGERAQLVRFTESGALDTTFGDAGIGPVGAFDSSLGLAVAGDDTIFVTALTAGGALTALSRIEPEGALDASFAGDGSVALPVSAGYDRALSVAVQPDGAIVLGGTGTHFNRGALVRLTPDGVLDPTFGTDGRRTSTSLEAVTSMAVDASGRVLVCGQDTSLRVRRLLPDGSDDPAFGEAGDFSVGNSRAANMAMGADGTVYVAGYARGAGGEHFGIKRLLDDGTADPSFGDAGELVLPIASPERHAVLAVQPDGRVVASGRQLLRIDADGALDPTFGTGGIASGGDLAQAIALAPDGAILLAWQWARPGEDSTLTVERRRPDGSLDPAFGTGGTATVPLGRATPGVVYVPTPIGLSVEADGSILIATTSGDGEALREHATLVRLGPDGSLDAGFGVDGRRTLVLGPGSSALHAIAAQPDGTTLLVGRAFGAASATSDFLALRLR